MLNSKSFAAYRAKLAWPNTNFHLSKLYSSPVLPLSQLGGRLGRRAKESAKITKDRYKTHQ